MRVAFAAASVLAFMASLALAACGNSDQNAEQTNTPPANSAKEPMPAPDSVPTTATTEQTSTPPANSAKEPIPAPDSVPTTATNPGAPEGTAATAPPAPQHQGRANGKFDKIDRNGDEIIEGAEFLAALKKRFARLDADKNGILEGSSEVKSSRRLGKIDSNGDNKISETEFLEGYHKLMERLDQDGNGELSAAEFSRFEEKRGSRTCNDEDPGRFSDIFLERLTV